jgi:adenosylcobinamide-phosphate synthase
VIVLGWLADRVLGDPARFHPVAGFGRLAALSERVLWADSRARGAVHAAWLVSATWSVAKLLDRGRLSRAAIVWATLGGRSLERAALALADAVERGELEQARRLAPTLVGRDPSELDAAELSRAAVESVAENTSDAVVAPLLWAALLGAPGAAAYRAVNTLDAIVGHKDARYLRFGWGAARLDDVANWPAARLAALLAIVLGGRPRAAWAGAWRDGPGHPSPNAGRVEGAFAGALGLRLGGLNRYSHGPELRPTLGSGAPPVAADVARAVRLARAVGLAAMLLAAWSAQR